MKKNYLAKIIAKDPEGLQLISACCFKAKIKIEDGINELIKIFTNSNDKIINNY